MPKYIAVDRDKDYMKDFEYSEVIDIGHYVDHTTMGLIERVPNPPNTIGYQCFKVIRIDHFPHEIRLVGYWEY